MGYDLIGTTKSQTKAATFGPMRLALCSLLSALILIFSDTSSVYPETQVPFPGNNGQTGLWDMPNARIMPDWHGRINFSSADPYQYWSGTVGLLDRLEFNARLTDITTVPFAGQEYARDKAIDVKFLLFKERDWLPAIALGATDIYGTGLFTSRYLAFSGRFKYLDLTFGIGQGILAGEVTEGKARDLLLTRPTGKDSRLFGGLEFHITDDLSFVGEYSSFDYEDLRGNSKADWPVNLGLKYRYGDYLLSSLSWQKGEELSFSLGLTVPFDPEMFLPWKKDPLYVPPEKVRMDAIQAENRDLASLVADQVSTGGFKHVRVAAKQDAIWVEFVNNKYLSSQKAMGRVVRIVVQTTPSQIGWLYLALVKDGVVVYSWKVHRNLVNAFLDNRLDEMALWEHSAHDLGGNTLWLEFAAKKESLPLKKAPRGQEDLAIHIAPRIESLLNDPSGFFKASLSVLTTLNYNPWKGGLLTGSLETVAYNNISTSNVVEEPFPPRSDFVDYRSDSNPRVHTLAFDQIFQLPWEVWARASLGYFESEYMGIGGEVFRFFDNGRLGVGLESQYVKKRALDSQFKAKDGYPEYHTAFLNLHSLLWPRQGIELGVKIGRFLGGDEGVRVDLSRTFKYFTLGAWVTATDTSDFVADYNRGYEDKGIYFSMPLSIFFDSDVAGRINYILRPWTRDPGATVAQPRQLYPFVNDGNPTVMKEHTIEMLQ